VKRPKEKIHKKKGRRQEKSSVGEILFVKFNRPAGDFLSLRRGGRGKRGKKGGNRFGIDFGVWGKEVSIFMISAGLILWIRPSHSDRKVRGKNDR